MIKNIKNRRNIACNNNKWDRARLLSNGDARHIKRLLHHKAIERLKNAAKSIAMDVSS